MSEDQKKVLEQQLWKIADTLRGKMDADDFRDYILGFIFYKYLSEKLEAYADDILKPDKIRYEAVEKHKDRKELLAAVKEEALDKLGYFLKPSELFSELARRGNAEGKSKFILDDLSKVLTAIEQSTMGSESEEDFGNLFEDLDLTSSKLGKSETDKNELIVKVLSHLNEIDFDLKNTESDVLGDAYEYLIGKFASGAGKKAGEFYTPQQVSIVLARLVTVGKTKLKSVYDPTCGSGSLLLRVAKEVKEVAAFYGQESNPTTYNLCRMNMIMHDVHYKKFDIKNEDTLERPQHIDQRFEAIVANPPFSAEWSASPLFMSDDRYAPYGRLAPKGTADFAFVQHMIHQLADNGTMACVLPHGVLFRGGAEGHIREYLIKDKNQLDAVIGLPTSIFYGTGIPTCILVLKKKREHSGNVLFIDASQHFCLNELHEEFSLLSSVAFIRADTSITTNNFLYQYLASPKGQYEIHSSIAGQAITRITLSKLRNYKFIFPEIPEQQKIASFLSVVDEKIQLLTRKKELLEQYKKGVMQQLFSGKLRFKDENGKVFSKWENKRLGDVGEFKNGLNKDKNDFGFGSPFVNLMDVFGKRELNIQPFDLVNSSDSEKKLYSMQKGDVLFIRSSVKRSGVGEAVVVNEDLPQTVYSGFLIRFRDDRKTLNQTFKKYCFANYSFRKELLSYATTSANTNINQESLAFVKLRVPVIEEQKKIANYLSNIDNKIESVTKQIIQTQTFKKGLLQQMFV